MQEPSDSFIPRLAGFACASAPNEEGPPVITRLAGDASSRRYFRAAFPSGATLVIMAAPDGGSVESFIAMTGLMGRHGAPVPSLLRSEGPLLAMEDLGDEMLQSRVEKLTPSEVETEYRAIITRLVKFQTAHCSQEDRGMECYSLRFDQAKLLYEVEFADQHFVKGYLRLNPDWSASAIMRLEWEKAAGELAGQMETLAHRDFHSRNIMVRGDRRVWIDYQDARMGRLHYDLTSLLLDPYVELGQDMEQRLARFYFGLISAKGAAPWGMDRFEDLYALSAAQRLYKALGTYGYQATVKNNPVYIPFIRPAAERLLRIMDQNPRLKKLGRLLAPYLTDAP